MPIPIQCAACSARLKAPDQVAGRRVKCPKCGQGIAVPAAAGGPPPPQPRPAAPPPRPSAATPPSPARMSVATFEELMVPKRLRRTIEEEVGNEQILWMGRPTPESLYAKAMIGMWAGLGLCILMIVGGVIGFTSIQDTTQKWIVAGAVAVALLTLGLPLATMPVWVRWLVNYRDCYVMTATRAIVFDNEKILQAVTKVYTPDELGERHLHVNNDGTGSIVFSNEVVDLGEHTTRHTQDRKGPGGEKVKVTTVKTRQLKGTKGFGYIDIENVEQVEAMLRKVLRLGPPGSKSVN